MRVTNFLTAMMMAIPVALAGCGDADSTGVAKSGRVVTSGEAQIGGDWELVAHTGETVRDEDFLGKPQLIYFGFAYCPDVCPASLSRMGAIADRIDPDGEAFHYLFFTVDPERDDVEAMAAYVESAPFAPGLVGLTGSREAMDDAIAAYKVYAAKRVVEGASDYLYDHSDYIIVMDADGTFADIIGPDESVAAAASELKRDFGL